MLQEMMQCRTYDIGMIQILEHLHLVENLLFVSLDEFLGNDPADNIQLGTPRT